MGCGCSSGDDSVKGPPTTNPEVAQSNQTLTAKEQVYAAPAEGENPIQKHTSSGTGQQPVELPNVPDETPAEKPFQPIPLDTPIDWPEDIEPSVSRLWKKSESHKQYYLKKVLGEGASCSVFYVVDRKTGEELACKFMRDGREDNIELWEAEVKILKTLSNPNHESVLTFVSAGLDNHFHTIFTRLCTGGELFDKIIQQELTEFKAAWVIRQCLNALKFCHERQVVHRDLKPENFVFAHSGSGSPIQLIDFGVAVCASDDCVVDTTVGSSYYMAPELFDPMLERTVKMWKASDMWSVGVIMYILLTGTPPFGSEPEDICRGKYDWIDVEKPSPAAMDLVAKLLILDPFKRLTAAEALKHEWVVGDGVPNTPLPTGIVDNLSKFQQNIRLKKAIGKAMRSRMSEKQKKELALIFRKFDRSGDGYLSADEISAFMAYCGKSEKDAQALLKKLDDNNDGVISVDEFANAQIMDDVANNEAKIKESFDALDANLDGSITEREVAMLCNEMNASQVKELMKDIDTNKDGKITFDEWMAALSKYNGTATKKAPVTDCSRRINACTNALDENQNGVISFAELKPFLSLLPDTNSDMKLLEAKYVLGIKTEDAAKLLKSRCSNAWDEKGNNFNAKSEDGVTWLQVEKAMLTYKTGGCIDRIRRIAVLIEGIDADNSGLLEAHEIKRFLSHATNIDDAEVEDLIGGPESKSGVSRMWLLSSWCDKFSGAWDKTGSVFFEHSPIGKRVLQLEGALQNMKADKK